MTLLSFPNQVIPIQQPVPTYQAHLSQFRKAAREVGIQVISLSSGKVVWEHEASTPLVPASLVKVLTSYAALKRLGPYYHFRTEIWASKAPQDGVVPGDVWIKGYGDPFLMTEKAWTLVQRLMEEGVREVHGNVYVDNTYFEPQVERICLDNKCDRPYNPVLSPTALVFNTVTFRFAPGSQVGAPAAMDHFPPGDYVQLTNETKTGKQGSRASLGIGCLRGPEPGRGQFFARGSLPLGDDSSPAHCVNIDDPSAMVTSVLRTLMEQVGIRVKGQAAGSIPVPSEAHRLVMLESPPLGDLLYGLNRYSNNFMAEMVLRVLGASTAGPPGTAAKGVAAVYETLRELGIPDAEVYLDSGSGLSRTCLASARTYGSVLKAAYEDFSIASEFISSLAANGHEGTLRKRLRNSDELVIRGKTGTLSNVIGFAGYVTGPERERYAVAILLNGVTNTWEARQAIDLFLEHLPNIVGE